MFRQDELHAALSVSFNPLGDLLLCGYKDSVKVFYTDVPGRDYVTLSTKGDIIVQLYFLIFNVTCLEFIFTYCLFIERFSVQSVQLKLNQHYLILIVELLNI